MTAPPEISPVHVIGAGLMGTSLGLALRRRGVVVHLSDTSSETARLANSLVDRIGSPPASEPGLVVVAVPPDSLGAVIADALERWPSAVVTDLGSVKRQPLVDVSRRRTDLDRYVGSHPMAGSERSGPLAASADLFEGRPWAVVPHERSAAEAVDVVEALAGLCGAHVVRMRPDQHDLAVARVSHLPHVLATLVAAQLDGALERDLALAGPGLRDVTRVAAGDPELWRQILTANAAAVAELLRAVRVDIDALLSGLSPADGSPNSAPVIELLVRGASGTAAIPGKHGTPVGPEARIFVAVPDEPGALARLLVDASDSNVNVEDLRIDHDLERPSGLVELSVRAEDVGRLEAALRSRGWTVHR